MRLIDADATINIVEFECGEWRGLARTITKAFKQLPYTQPKTGKWIERESGTEDKQEGWPTVIVCSQCDFPATTFYSEDCESRTQIKTRFCPHCGARMVMK